MVTRIGEGRLERDAIARRPGVTVKVSGEDYWKVALTELRQAVEDPHMMLKTLLSVW
jgi:hypothetical protein